jgi:uncharacterized membrane protein YbhN (UPF0104 family)
LASYAITLATIGLTLWLTRDQWHQFKNITQVSPPTIVWLSVLLLFIEIANGYTLKLILETFGIKLKVVEWLGLDFMRAFGNYLPLNAGIVSNAAYLKYKKELPITKFMSYLIGNMLIMIGTYGGLSVILLLLRYLATNRLNLPILLVSLGFFITTVIIMSVKMEEISYDNKIINWLKSAHDGWCLIKQQKSLVVKVIILQIIIIILLSLRYWVVFKELEYSMDIYALVVLTVMTTIVRFASLFPGNLGFGEALSGALSESFGLGFSQGVLAAVIIRITEVFWIFLLGAIFSFILINNKTIPETNKL